MRIETSAVQQSLNSQWGYSDQTLRAERPGAV